MTNTAPHPTSLDEMIKFDALEAAEKLTGKSFKEDKETHDIAMDLMWSNSMLKREKLQELKDSYHGISIKDYLRIIEDDGFEQLLVEDFIDSDAPEGLYEKYYVYGHQRDGFILSFDSYSYKIDDNVDILLNGGNLYYNWKPLVDNYFDTVSSGSFINKDVWAGYHDCREGLLHNVNNLRNRGDMVNPWVARPFLWLLNYAQERDVKKKAVTYDEINREKISKLSDWAQKIIGPENDETKLS